MAQAPRVTQVGVLPQPVNAAFAPQNEQLPGTDAMSRALINAGGQIGRAGDTLHSIIMRDQEMQNETDATDRYVALSQRINEGWARFAALEGRAATDAFAAYRDSLRAAVTETLDGAPNPAVRRMLALRAEQTAAGALMQGVAHNTRQTQIANIRASEAAAGEAVANGLRLRDNPAGVERSLLEGLSEIRKQGEAEGLDDVAIRGREAAFRGTFYGAIIATQMQTDVLGAAATFNRVRDSLDAQSQIRIANQLDDPLRSAEASRRVMSIVTPGDPASVRDRIFRAENAAGDARRNPHPGATASGPGQITNETWDAYAGRLGLQPSQRNERAAHVAIYDLYMLDAQQAIGRPLTAPEQYAAWFLGIAGAKAFITAPPDADARQLYGRVAGEGRAAAAFRTNPGYLEPGMTVGQVMANLTRRVGATPARDYTAAERPEMLRRVLETAGDDPRMQAAMVGQFNMWWNAMEARQDQARATLNADLQNVGRALDAGATNVSIPEDRIRQLNPPDVAERIIDEMRTRQIGGIVMQSVRFASPQQVADIQRDLIEGNGPITEMLRRQTNPDLTTDEGRAADIVRRGALRDVIATRIAQRNEDIRRDPAAYVLADPEVQRTMRAAAGQPTPETMGAFVAATDAAQARVGVAPENRRILTIEQSQRLAGEIARIDPGSGTPEAPDNASLRLQALARTYGPAWPRVFNDLQRDGNLPPMYRVLGNIPSAVGQADFSRMLMAMRTAGGDGKFREAVRRASPAEEQRLTRELNTYLDPFRRSALASGQSGGADLFAVVAAGVENLAAYYVLQGQDAGTALRNATDRVLNDKYEFASTFRVPRTLPDGRPLSLAQVQRSQAHVMRTLTESDIAPPADAPPDLPEGEGARILWRAARDGFWVTNETDTGVVLMYETQNGGRLPVRRREGGRVEMFFDRLPEPTMQGSDPQRDSPARGVTPIPGYDVPPNPSPTGRPGARREQPIPEPRPRRERPGGEPPRSEVRDGVIVASNDASSLELPRMGAGIEGRDVPALDRVPARDLDSLGEANLVFSLRRAVDEISEMTGSRRDTRVRDLASQLAYMDTVSSFRLRDALDEIQSASIRPVGGPSSSVERERAARVRAQRDLMDEVNSRVREIRRRDAR